MKKAIQFGAGNIGRGFIGALLSEAGYDLLFADINLPVIDALKKDKRYTVEIVGAERGEQVISPVSGILSDDEALLNHIGEAAIITTAVGPNVLKHIALAIAAGLTLRRRGGSSGPLNIIACENMIGGSTTLRKEVIQHLDRETLDWLPGRVGFPDSAVDRIVPPMEPSDDLLRVRVEEYSEWIVDRNGFAGDIPSIDGMRVTDRLEAYLERKLFTLNTGHSITAYLGALEGYATTRESLLDDAILRVVKGAMRESGEVLIRRYGFEREAHSRYIEKVLDRFRNPWIEDKVERVGRQPLRKLGENDRLIKPLRGTLEYGIPRDNLELGIAAALCFRSDGDEQTEELDDLFATYGAREAIRRITSLDDEETLTRLATVFAERREKSR